MKTKIILGFILLFCFQISLYAQTDQDTSLTDISLKTYVQDETVALNREVVYEVELKWQGDLSRFKITEALEPNVTNLTVRGTGSTNRITTDSNGREISIKKITYYFKPIEIGMAYINGVTIRYEDTILNSKESLLASRLSVKIVEPIPETIVMVLIISILLFSFQFLILRKDSGQASGQVF